MKKTENKFSEHVQLSLKISPALKSDQNEKTIQKTKQQQQLLNRSDKVIWNKPMLVCIYLFYFMYLYIFFPDTLPPQKRRNHILLGLGNKTFLINNLR